MVVTHKVQIRPWRMDDLTELVRLANNRRIWIELRDVFPHPYTTEAGRAWIEFAARNNSPTHFAIESEGLLVGGVGYIPGRDIERCGAEVGYWVGEPYWGRGIATAAVGALIDMLRAAADYTRIFAVPFASNTASRRVLERSGFRLDAVLECSAVKDGRVKDQCLYSQVLR